MTDIIVRTRGFEQFVVPEINNAVVARLSTPPDTNADVTPLAEGYQIGPELSSGSLSWVPQRVNGLPSLGPLGSNLSTCVSFGCLGDFFAQTAYMGVEFDIDGQTHYGWVYLSSHAGRSNVHGYAYNTVPGEMIFAGQVPEPSTWAMLIAGGFLLSWRCRRN